MSEQLAAGGLSINSTAEEMAWHIVVSGAAAGYDDGLYDEVNDFPADLVTLPSYDRFDTDFEGIRSDMVEDFDVLMLFAAQLDSIEPDAVATESMGFANLRPSDWFKLLRS